MAPDAMERVSKYIKSFSYIVEQAGDAPRTLEQWIQKMKLAMAAPSAPHLGETGNEYMMPWHIRSWLLCLMKQAGVKRLLVKDERVNLNAFCDSFPDTKGHLHRLRAHFYNSHGERGLTTSKFLELCNCSCFPELLSMWACFAIDQGLREQDFHEFDAKAWRAEAEKY